MNHLNIENIWQISLSNKFYEFFLLSCLGHARKEIEHVKKTFISLKFLVFSELY